MNPPLKSQILVRRWRSVVAGVTATAILTTVAILLIPVKYQARALIVLLPASTSLEKGANPFTELGGLETAAGVLALAMNTEEVADAVDRTSPNASFEVERDDTTSGPVIRLTMNDRNPVVTLKSLDTLVAQAQPTLNKLQANAGAPQDTLIRVALVTREEVPTMVRQDQLRAVLSVAAIGLLLTGVVVAMLDRRSRSREAVSSSDDKQEVLRAETARKPDFDSPTNVHLRPPTPARTMSGVDSPTTVVEIRKQAPTPTSKRAPTHNLPPQPVVPSAREGGGKAAQAPMLNNRPLPRRRNTQGPPTPNRALVDRKSK